MPTKLKIQTGANNPILRKKSAQIQQLNKKTKKFISDMVETLKKENGLGLAAPQVGQNIRIIIVRFNYDTHQEMIKTLINPEILSHSKGTILGEEGCLSLPNIFKPVERYKKVRIKFKDLKWNDNVLDLEDLNARIVQHEIDHLDGILFIDKVKGDLEKSDMSMVTF
jgi:peptide deformylase